MRRFLSDMLVVAPFLAAAVFVACSPTSREFGNGTGGHATSSSTGSHTTSSSSHAASSSKSSSTTASSTTGAGGTGGTSGTGGTGGSSTCTPPRVECSGVCTDTTSDPLNCGACGNSCNGVPCAASACQPFVIAAGQLAPWAVAVDATNVYWTDNVAGGMGNVMQAAKPNGAPIVLASGQSNPYGIATDGTNVWWTDGGDGVLRMVPIGGGTVTDVVPGLPGPYGLTMTQFGPIWTENNGNGSVEGWSGSLYTFASGQDFPYGVTSDNTLNVYWTNNGSSSNSGSVWTVPFAGGTPTMLAAGLDYPTQIILENGILYWTNQGSNQNTGSVMSCPVTGCNMTPTVLASMNNAIAIASDGVTLYYTNTFSFTVEKLPIGGGSPVVIAQSPGYPPGIAVDSTTVWWGSDPPPASAGQILGLPL